jgi:hypothetical protein
MLRIDGLGLGVTVLTDVPYASVGLRRRLSLVIASHRVNTVAHVLVRPQPEIAACFPFIDSRVVLQASKLGFGVYERLGFAVYDHYERFTIPVRPA